ncbi:UMTA methyltransferase family protein [Drepanopeziza brunnea f. sp. 'multigermtubi' MB_m1]|uniref:UMTA methyltransferase family protein n=1 Tax=Marssonina brunnea f. sp. multigermtubi (strain MB_m1) TaxID=1072389 RepID=K1XDJ3_MARBU|nr:UMTA methyltransferase family protein [Drepanopeziza brunnea f. sp. 'multigermtubi' MB_m1]EKD18943.1 UMTA methyltransferase family protein [Drepanopeziza brunnea f. sp. 'multigermtubi' MB_m1]
MNNLANTSSLDHQGEDDAIEADSFSDSGYEGQSVRSSLESLTDSTFEYHYEHGHRYHRDGQSLLPNDETEQDRLDLQHHIFKLILNGELTRTVLPPTTQKVIDVGTGTGIWAIELGDAMPSATIVGVDQSPIQPVWVPPNVSFEIDDVNKPWLQAERSVDFVYIRTMAGSIKSWPELLTEAYKTLKPGGKLEFVEFGLQWECLDGTFDPNGSCGVWTKEFHKIATELMGIDFDPIPKMPRWLREAGFEDIAMHDEIVPIGPWPRDRRLKNIGRYFLSNMLEGGVENYTLMLFTRAGWDETSVHAMLGGVRKDLLDTRIHAFTRAWFITATKPLR